MTSKEYKPKTLEWFQERIGKRIYRDKKLNCCDVCKHVEEVGLIVADDFHAQYLSDVDASFADCGVYMNYHDVEKSRIKDDE